MYIINTDSFLVNQIFVTNSSSSVVIIDSNPQYTFVLVDHNIYVYDNSNFSLKRTRYRSETMFDLKVSPINNSSVILNLGDYLWEYNTDNDTYRIIGLDGGFRYLDTDYKNNLVTAAKLNGGAQYLYALYNNGKIELQNSFASNIYSIRYNMVLEKSGAAFSVYYINSAGIINNKTTVFINDYSVTNGIFILDGKYLLLFKQDGNILCFSKVGENSWTNPFNVNVGYIFDSSMIYASLDEESKIVILADLHKIIKIDLKSSLTNIAEYD